MYLERRQEWRQKRRPQTIYRGAERGSIENITSATETRTEKRSENIIAGIRDSIVTFIRKIKETKDA